MYPIVTKNKFANELGNVKTSKCVSSLTQTILEFYNVSDVFLCKINISLLLYRYLQGNSFQSLDSKVLQNLTNLNHM